MKPKKFYIIRPEIEIEYMKNPILGRLYIMLNYWRFIKAGVLLDIHIQGLLYCVSEDIQKGRK